MKIGSRSRSRRKSNSALEKGHIKLIGQYQVLQGVGTLIRGKRFLKVCIG